MVYVGNNGDEETAGSFQYVVAKKGDVAPGVPGATFARFKDPLLNESATVVFLARLNGAGAGGQWGIWKHYASEGAGTTREATGSPVLTPAIRLNAHSASWRKMGSFAAAFSASWAASAFGPMLPRAPAAKIRT